MNSKQSPQSHISDQLNRLAMHDRSEPDDGFERMIGQTMRQPAACRPVPGRRRRSAAWVPFAAAAFVGLFASMVWPTSQMVDSDQMGSELMASAPSIPDAQDADLLLVSFETLDTILNSDEAFAADLQTIESYMDATDTDLLDISLWMDLGESL
ncbi:MAG TPA: hypothetical protein ENJ00_10005 [Phycisphaerales bacterium]|nr:hypothetical protein [Phycisphaerales bacterium]